MVGHCLPIDPSYLSWQVKQSLGRPSRFVELANDVNDAMPDYVVRRVTGVLNDVRLPVNDSRVLLLGLAYKRNSADARESPAPVIARRLVALGADVRAADPHVESPLPAGVASVEADASELAETDLVVVLTDHDAFDRPLVAGAKRRCWTAGACAAWSGRTGSDPAGAALPTAADSRRGRAGRRWHHEYRDHTPAQPAAHPSGPRDDAR